MNKKTMIIFISILLIGLLLFFMTFNKNQTKEKTIRIVSSSNFAGGPTYILEELNLIEKYIGNVKIDYTYASSGSELNEAFASNRADGGSFGINNILVGVEKKIPYKIVSSLYFLDQGIQTCNPKIKNLKDINANDKIAISSFTGSQAMLLYMASEKELGSYNALKKQTVLMPGDQAALALISKSSITLHVSEHPNRTQENEAGCHTIISSLDINKDLMSGYILFTENFYSNNQDFVNAYLLAIEEAINLIYEKDEQALEILSRRINVDKDTIIKSLEFGEIKYELHKNNIEPYIKVAFKTGLISSELETNDVFFK